MTNKAWGTKLGSQGSCVPFCERHQIIGIGWNGVDPGIVKGGSWDELWGHLNQTGWYQGNARKLGSAVGTLYRFARKCCEQDYVLYYDPPKKHVRVCRVVSGILHRDFETDDPVDIWHYRRVEYPIPPIPILDFYGGLKGSLLGPQGSFWSLGDVFAIVEQIVLGESPHVIAAPDAELTEVYDKLRSLMVKRAEALNEKDWEGLVADYLRAQGASVDEATVGGNQPVIDAEARFEHGELPGSVWRVQVKRWQNKQVDWSEVDWALKRVGDASLLYVSVFGFTDEARRRAEEEGIVLLEAGDFTRFLLSGRLRPSLLEKMRLPQLL